MQVCVSYPFPALPTSPCWELVPGGATRGTAGTGAPLRPRFCCFWGVKKALSRSEMAPSLRRGADVGAEPQRAATRQRSVEGPIKSRLWA